MGDSLLWRLISIAERGLSLPIVLTVGGTTIQGTIVSEAEYLERLSELVKASSPDRAEQAEHLREFLRSVPSTHDESAMEYLDEGLDPEEVRELRDALSQPFIHLSDTRIFQASGRFVDIEAPWRGRLSAVDGYWLPNVV